MGSDDDLRYLAAGLRQVAAAQQPLPRRRALLAIAGDLDDLRDRGEDQEVDVERIRAATADLSDDGLRVLRYSFGRLRDAQLQLGRPAAAAYVNAITAALDDVLLDRGAPSPRLDPHGVDDDPDPGDADWTPRG